MRAAMCFGCAVSLLLTLCLSFPGRARASDKASESEMLAPSFSTFPAAPAPGGFNLRDYVPPDIANKVIDDLGYDPSRSWSYGTQLAEIFYLGDFSDGSSLPEFNLQTIASLTGLSLSNLSLEEYPILRSQTIEGLARAVPYLEDFSLRDIPPLYELLRQTTGRSVFDALKDRTLKDILESSAYGRQIGALQLGRLENLSEFPLESIPNVEFAPLGRFEGYRQLRLSDVPGLPSVPLSSFLRNVPGFPSIVARVDLVLGFKEQQRLRTVTGSDREGFAVPCEEKQCRHIELSRISLFGGGFLDDRHGRAWISGLDREVEGGRGCLRWLNGGKEPTGRHPYGPAFKVVLLDTDERAAKANFGIFFRIGAFCGRSPYFIGPFPFFSVTEKDVLFLGFDDWSLAGGGTSSPDVDVPPTIEQPQPPGDNRITQQPSSDEQVDADTETFGYPLADRYPVTSEYGSRVHPVTGKYSFHNGIDLAAPEGTPVVAVADGTVTSVAYDLGACGTYLRIEHGNGNATGMCHLSSVSVVSGDSVKKGQPVAAVGSTGVGTGPHLHFLFYRNGNHVNPREKINF